MSNLVKQVYIIGNGDDKRIINSNDNAERILNSRQNPQQIFREGDLGNCDENEEGQEFTSIQAEEVMLPSPEELVEQARLQAEQMLAQANEQVEAMLQNAQEEAEAAFEQAKAEGFAQGQEEAVTEKNALLQSLEQEYEERKNLLEEEYSTSRETMETELVEVLIPIFRRVIGVELEKDKDIILYLCKKAILGLESDKHFVVRTSQDNRAYLLEHQEEVLGNLQNGVTVEFLSDSTMSDEACVIETESGMVDCGMNTQIENLVKAIKKLSMD